MGLQNDIETLLADVLAQHQGNKAAAASSLGVNSVTFWGWVSGNRKFNPALCHAIDLTGAKLLLPGHDLPVYTPQDKKIDELLHQIESLQQENRELRAYKIKWEGHLETERARSGQK